MNELSAATCGRGRGGRGRVRAVLGLRVSPADHRDSDVHEESREQEFEDVLGEDERSEPAGECADGGEELEDHPEAEVRDTPLEIDAGRCAARHDHADEADADRGQQRQIEDEGQERDDEQPAPEPEERPEQPRRDSTDDQNEPVDHRADGFAELSLDL